MTIFNQLLDSPILLEKLSELQYNEAREIQVRSLPEIKQGKDILGIAQTGSGKTASFCLPLIDNLLMQDKLPEIPSILILVPTRELCFQINQTIGHFVSGTQIKSTAIYGGVKQIFQAQDINSGVHFIVATPGRLLDLLRKELITLKGIEVLVLDEADRMFDMGFSEDLNSILNNLPSKRQNLFYSATMPPAIRAFSDSLLDSPVVIEITKNSSIPKHIIQTVYDCEGQDKLALLKKIIIEDVHGSVLIFVNTRRTADEVSDYLNKNNIESRSIHSDKKQAEREKILSSYTKGTLNILVATDLVARGIDVETITFVVNFDMPIHAETYVHRIGRTGRSGRSGTAISFCSKNEQKYLKAIEALIGNEIQLATR